jgi:hypothetical protein
MAGVKLPKVKTPAQMKAEMAVGRARDVLPKAEREINLGNMLRESAVKEPMYHASKADVSTFSPEYRTELSSMGHHFGTADQANFRTDQYDFSGDNVNIGKYYLDIKNPLETSHMGSFAPDHLAEQMMDLGILDPDKYDALSSKLNYESVPIGAELVKMLKKNGYDGLKYANEREGEGFSYVPFEPTQVKSAIGNQGTYDTSDPDITKAHGGIVKMSKGGLKPVKAPKVSAPKVESPTVMKRSDVSDLFRLINEREGSYGAKRVERAADEIPNLEKLYTLDALRSAFSGDNARALMTMKPADFEKYAAPLLTNLSQQSNDNIANLKAIQNVGGFADVPFFLVNKELAGSTGLPWITGHEGRHRSRAMDEAGVQAGLVQFLPRAELREPFPRRSQEQYIDAIRKEMALSGNKVKPEKYYLNENDEKSFQRPTIDLPDLYADGGAVKMKDGGDPDQEFYDRMREEFSVYNKPTYGNEIPGTPTIDQQRYELTMKGRQEAENRARTTRDSLTAMDPSGTLGIVDALKTVGKAVVAPIAYVGGNAFDWLQTGKVDPAKSKARVEKIESWMQPKTQEGGEILEGVSKVGPAITGSEMGFGMHPNLWVSGIGMTTPKQTAAGLRLGAERAAPFAKDVGSMASELYMSGKMSGMVAPNMYAVAPDGKPSKVLAPANESGFYSPTEAAALNLQRKSGAGQAFLNDIMKGENVKADEIKTMGLDTFLKDKKNVTADEVRDYIAQNKIQLGESVYGYRRPPEAKPESPEDFLRFENLGEEIDSARNFEAETKAPKFESYQLPGGENYREIVLTLPFKEPKMPKGYLVEKMDNDDGSSYYFAETPTTRSQAFKTEEEAQAELQRMTEGLRGFRENLVAYQSSHWDEPNALAHLRVSDRVTDGKKTLLVDEVQSDWHQAGREQGYKNTDIDKSTLKVQNLDTDNPNDVGVYDKNGNEIWVGEATGTDRQIIDRAIKELDLNKVPDAPYKDDWYQLALRRAIKEAIDGGYDRVALPTGARVADRFDLSKQVDRIDYNKNDDGTYSMSAIKDGRQVFSKEDLDENELSAIVGKDVAKKMVGDEGAAQYDADIADELGVGVVKSLTGLDLSVGGKGMKKYYDEIYPSYLKKFGKKYGANVGMTSVQIEPPTDKIFRDLGKFHAYTGQGRETKEFNTYAEALEFLGLGKEPLHYMDITPAMRKEFSTGIPMKRGGKVQFANNIDAMRLALSKG